MMMLFWNLAAACVIISAVLIAAVPARWLFRSLLLWIVSPIPGYVAIVVWDSMNSPRTPHAMSDALLGFSLVSAFLLIPWLVCCGVGFLLGLLLRGLFRTTKPKPPGPIVIEPSSDR